MNGQVFIYYWFVYRHLRDNVRYCFDNIKCDHDIITHQVKDDVTRLSKEWVFSLDQWCCREQQSYNLRSLKQHTHDMKILYITVIYFKSTILYCDFVYCIEVKKQKCNTYEMFHHSNNLLNIFLSIEESRLNCTSRLYELSHFNSFILVVADL